MFYLNFQRPLAARVIRRYLGARISRLLLRVAPHGATRSGPAPGWLRGLRAAVARAMPSVLACTWGWYCLDPCGVDAQEEGPDVRRAARERRWTRVPDSVHVVGMLCRREREPAGARPSPDARPAASMHARRGRQRIKPTGAGGIISPGWRSPFPNTCVSLLNQ